jgi:hypothetical protein
MMSETEKKMIQWIIFRLNACGEIETAHPGYLGSQDTFYVGTLKGCGPGLSTDLYRYLLQGVSVPD